MGSEDSARVANINIDTHIHIYIAKVKRQAVTRAILYMRSKCRHICLLVGRSVKNLPSKVSCRQPWGGAAQRRHQSCCGPAPAQQAGAFCLKRQVEEKHAGNQAASLRPSKVPARLVGDAPGPWPTTASVQQETSREAGGY
jgi:hypothetical protein